METRATITIPMLPPPETSPNWHGHWSDKAIAVRAFRACAGYAALNCLALEPSIFRFERVSDGLLMDVVVNWSGRRRTQDDDNVWASLKAARDGIADVLFAGEDRYLTQGTLTQQRGDGSVVVTLSPRERP